MKVNKCNPPFTGVNYMITFFMRNKKKRLQRIILCKKVFTLIALSWFFIHIFWKYIFYHEKKMTIKKSLYLISKTNVFIFMISIANEIYLYFFNIKNTVWHSFVNFKSFFLKTVKAFSYFDLFISDGTLYVWKHKTEPAFKPRKTFFHYSI